MAEERASVNGLRSFLSQVEAMETDGFQADTEDDEDENDCVIVDTQAGESCDLRQCRRRLGPQRRERIAIKKNKPVNVPCK